MRGVSAAFFDTPDLTGNAQKSSPVVRSADTALKDAKDPVGNPLNPANSARFEGYLAVLTPGAYRFTVELEKHGAEATLTFDHLPNPVFLHGVTRRRSDDPGQQPTEFLELKPGMPTASSWS